MKHTASQDFAFATVYTVIFSFEPLSGHQPHPTECNSR